MTKVWVVEYYVDRGRPDTEIKAVCASPASAQKAIMDAIEEDSSEGANVFKTSKTSVELAKQPPSADWYVSGDGLYAQKNRWQFIIAEEHEVLEEAVEEVVDELAKRRQVMLNEQQRRTLNALAMAATRITAVQASVNDGDTTAYEVTAMSSMVMSATAELWKLFGMQDITENLGQEEAA